MVEPLNLGIILTVPEPLIPAEGVAHESVPDPSVSRIWFAVPSVFGIVIAPIVTVPDVSTLVMLLSPSLILFEALTVALYPIAVALVKLFALASDPLPIKVLFDPVVLVSPALDPIPVFEDPVVVFSKTLTPKEEL